MSRSRMRQTMVVCGLVALVCLPGACKEKTPCDEGQALRDSYCWYVDAAASGADTAAPTGEAGAGEAGQGSPEVALAAPSAFGRPCAVDGDCAAPASLCAPQLFYCTALACDADPTLCPVGWVCMDVSAYAGRPQTMCFRSL